MKLFLPLVISSRRYEFLSNIFNTLAIKGYDTMIVGGFIRDAMLGIADHNTEIDLCSTATPDEIMGIFLDSKSISVVDFGGKLHGTLKLIGKNNDFQVEITTLRSDIKTFGRQAEVEFCRDFYRDSLRRDFTMNALYCGLEGDIKDYHNGICDIEQGAVRFIGNPRQRIQEDYLRILRYFRFANYFGNFDGDIITICSEMQSGMQILSKERIRQELVKMFKKPSYNALKIMQDLGILKEILPFDVDIEVVGKIESGLDIAGRADQDLKFALMFAHTSDEEKSVWLTRIQKKMIRDFS